jgi:fatty acid desaturase
MAEAPRSTSPQKDKAAGLSASPAAQRVNWEHINIWFWRLLALAWLLNGLFAWAAIIGVDPSATRPFEARAATFQAVTIYFSVVDLLAATGLWLLAPWGAVVWLIAAVSRIVMAFAFPAAAGLSLLAIAGLAACIACFMVLNWVAGRQSES